MGKWRIHGVLVITLFSLIYGTTAKQDKSGLLKLLTPKIRQIKSPLSASAGQSLLGRLYGVSFEAFKKFYEESLALVNSTYDQSFEDGLQGIAEGCGSVNVQECYTGIAAETTGGQQHYTGIISEVLTNLFCKPIGFRFENYFGKQTTPDIFISFPLFGKKFNEQKKLFPYSDLIEIWMSNVMLLSQSPLQFYSSLMAAAAKDFADLYGDQLPQWTPSMFAAKCNGQPFSSYKLAARLLKGAEQKSYIMDILLRGLFTVRSASYYIPGGAFENYAGAILEGLDVGIGKKCDLLKDNDEDCDGVGRYPIMNFPVPRGAEYLIPQSDDCIF